MKQITARQAFHARPKPQSITWINECPECHGTGKINRRDCPCCGNEPDDKTLVKRGGYWFKDVQK